MKSKATVIICLLLVELSFGQTDSTNHIHEFESEGPVSIQILWLSADTAENFAEKAAWLKAAFKGSTKKYSRSEFEDLSTDYKIKWHCSSINGVHRLGVTFAQQQYALATEMLDELLNNTAYRIKYVHEWRKEELYHYNYYKNDRDSLIKWWANGSEAYYRYLEKNSLQANGASLIEKLGRPHVVSSVGRVNSDIIKSRLAEIVKTRKSNGGFLEFLIENNARKVGSSFSKEAIVLKQENPILTFASCSEMSTKLSNMVNHWEFSFEKSYGEIYLNSGYTAGKAAFYIPSDESMKWALIQYYKWLQKNKNCALAKAYLNLGIWESSFVEDVKAGEFEVKLVYKTFSLEP